MMSTSDVLLSTVPAQGNTLFDPRKDEYAVQALLGTPPIDMGFYFDPTPFNPSDFPDFSDLFDDYQVYQVPADPSASPKALSPPFLPSSPLSSAGDFSDVGSMDTQVQHLDLSPTVSSDAPLANNEEVKPIKIDLGGFHFSDVGSIDTQAPNLSLSPTALSDLAPLANNEEVKPIKIDLEGFHYNPQTRKWVCSKCEGDFVSTHEARRHSKTAAKCTGTKVKCLRCGDHIHSAPWSRKRHFLSKKCQKKGRKRGVPNYSVSTAFEEVEA